MKSHELSVLNHDRPVFTLGLQKDNPCPVSKWKIPLLCDTNPGHDQEHQHVLTFYLDLTHLICCHVDFYLIKIS